MINLPIELAIGIFHHYLQTMANSKRSCFDLKNLIATAFGGSIITLPNPLPKVNVFTKESLLTLNKETQIDLFSYDKFDVKIFLEPHNCKAYSIWDIMRDLCNLPTPQSKALISHIFKNLINEEVRDIEAILKNIIRFFKPVSFMISALSENNHFFSSFIKNGLNPSIIKWIIKKRSQRALISFIEEGLMTEKVDLDGAITILSNFPHDITHDLFANIGNELIRIWNEIEKVNDTITNGVITTILEGKSDSRCKIGIFLEMIGLLPLSSILTLLGLTHIYIEGTVPFELKYFIADSVGIIKKRDFSLGIKTSLFAQIISLYQSDIAFSVFKDIRDLYGVLSPLETDSQIDSQIDSHGEQILNVILTRADFTIRDKWKFFEEIVHFYPESLIEKMFRGIGKLIESIEISTKPNDQIYCINVVSDLLYEFTKTKRDTEQVQKKAIIKKAIIKKAIIISLIKSYPVHTLSAIIVAVSHYIERTYNSVGFLIDILTTISRRPDSNSIDKGMIIETIYRSLPDTTVRKL